MMEESPDRVVVKHLKNANSNLFYKISSLHSVYIPKIYKCEQDGEWFVIVEEYLEGENLEQYLRSQCHNFDPKVQSYFRVIGVVLGD